MDDDSKRPPRRNGPKSQGPRGRGDRQPGQRGTGQKGPGKSGRPAFSGDRKPFAKRRDDAPAGEGAPQRDFKRSFRPRAEGDAPRGERPFRKGPRPEGGGGERRPYEKREGAGGPRPGRVERGATRDGEPRRDFNCDRKPREEGGEAGSGRGFQKRPFRKEEGREGRPYSKRDGDKPFASRRERPAQAEGERGERRFVRPERDFSERKFDRPRRDSGERKFDRPKRDFGEKKFDRPKRDFGDRRPRPAEATEGEGERIAKRLARAGIASRRDAEELIAAGRVKVNGQVLNSPAFNVTAADVIHLDGTEIPPIERTRLFLFHKPAGVVTTNRDPEGRKTVFDVLPAELPRLMTIGRLDINTEGLLLLTNDGGLSRVLELPATGWLRRYRVRVHGKVEEKALADLREGVAVDGVFYGAVEAALERVQGTNAWLTIGLREGKNREVKNILGALGLEVTRLIRISYGPFQLGELPEGHVLEIKGRMLRDQLGERLIEESGANFEADIAKPFSNKPVRRAEPVEDRASRPRIVRDGERGPIGEGGLIKRRKRREDSRDEALGKLSTRPERGFAPRGDFGKRGDKPAFGAKKGEREQRPMEPPGQRRANVWMAPGARPQGKAQAETPSPRERGEGKGEGQRPRYKDKAAPRGERDEASRRPSSAPRAPSPRQRGEGKGRPHNPKKR